MMTSWWRHFNKLQVEVEDGPQFILRPANSRQTAFRKAEYDELSLGCLEITRSRWATRALQLVGPLPNSNSPCSQIQTEPCMWLLRNCITLPCCRRRGIIIAWSHASNGSQDAASSGAGVGRENLPQPAPPYRGNESFQRSTFRNRADRYGTSEKHRYVGLHVQKFDHSNCAAWGAIL